MAHGLKIAFFQDVDPMIASGGAELNDRAMIVEGIRRGHDVEVIVANQNDDAYAIPELAIFSNSMGFGTAFYDQMTKNNVPYVIFAHDYGPWVCKHRLFYPMEERCKSLCYLRDRWRPYILGAKLVVCLSPLHLEAWRFAYPELQNAVCVPSAVPEAEFFDKKEPRSGACAVHSGLPFKGWPQVREWAAAHPETPLTIIGPVPGDAPKNVIAADRVPYGGMNDFYNRFETFVHLPDRPAPFDRTCLPGKSKVLTEAGWKRIMDVQIGERVFTHEGRFREVTATSKRSSGFDRTVAIRLPVSTTKSPRVLTATENHPVLTRHGWTRAGDLKTGDEVAALAHPCPGCGRLTYFKNDHCSISCANSLYEHALTPFEAANVLLPEVELARLAGFVDGEGTIGAKTGRRTKGDISLYFMVTNTHFGILEHFLKVTGIGRIVTRSDGHPKHKRVYRWIVEKQAEVLGLIRALRPFLMVKADQADLVISALEVKRKVASGAGQRSDLQIALNEAYAKTTALNGWYKERPPLFESEKVANEIGSFCFVPIRVEIRQPRPYSVYNLEVAEDHSYVAQGVVVHNCAEAYLSGCRVVGNQNVGALSWPAFSEGEKSVRAMLGAAPRAFWDAVEGK